MERGCASPNNSSSSAFKSARASSASARIEPCRVTRRRNATSVATPSATSAVSWPSSSAKTATKGPEGPQLASGEAPVRRRDATAGSRLAGSTGQPVGSASARAARTPSRREGAVKQGSERRPVLAAERSVVSGRLIVGICPSLRRWGSARGDMGNVPSMIRREIAALCALCRSVCQNPRRHETPETA